MKKSVIIMLGLAMALGLVLTGCPTEAAPATNAGNSKFATPTFKLTFGTQSNPDVILQVTMKDHKKYDVKPELWVREEGRTAVYKVVSGAGAAVAMPPVEDVSTEVRLDDSGDSAVAGVSRWKIDPYPGNADGSVYITEFDTADIAILSGPATGGTGTKNENPLVWYAAIKKSELNQVFARAPFVLGENVQIGVRAVLDTAKMNYFQQDISVNPSDIKWSKSFKRY